MAYGAGPGIMLESGDPGDDEPPESKGGKKGRVAASQARLVWWGFRKHKVAMISLVVLLFLLLCTVFTEFMAPRTTGWLDEHHPYAPPQRLHMIDRSDGSWQIGPYVYGFDSSEQDPESLRIIFKKDETQKIPLQFFAKGQEYKLFGVIPWDRHLIGPKNPDDPVYLLGADAIGRDQLSRLIYATRISMSVGIVGVVLAFLLGITLGGISGYFGGRVDTFVQRLIEFVMSVPALPLWMGLTAAIPVTVGPVRRYFYISVILAILAWTTLAREVRGRFLALREEDFVTSAWLDGSSRRRVMFRHMLPSTTSHLIATLTLSIPGVILAETALSFLQVGLLPPVVSWGTLLNDAQSFRVINSAPWLLAPGAMVVIAVLALNFIGDGLRDAADPYHR